MQDKAKERKGKERKKKNDQSMYSEMAWRMANGEWRMTHGAGPLVNDLTHKNSMETLDTRVEQ